MSEHRSEQDNSPLETWTFIDDTKAKFDFIRSKLSVPLPKDDSILELDGSQYFRVGGIGGPIDAVTDYCAAQCIEGEDVWTGAMRIRNDGDVPILIEYVRRMTSIDVVLCRGTCPIGEGWQTIALESVP